MVGLCGFLFGFSTITLRVLQGAVGCFSGLFLLIFAYITDCGNQMF